MTLKEFIEKNPSAVEEAAKCKNLDEFKSLTEKVGIKFESQEKLEKAFELVKSKTATELTDDALDAVSGGSARIHKASDVFINTQTGKAYTTSKGKKAQDN